MRQTIPDILQAVSVYIIYIKTVGYDIISGRCIPYRFGKIMNIGKLSCKSHSPAEEHRVVSVAPTRYDLFYFLRIF